MKLEIKYESISEKHVDEAISLILSAYNEEKKAIPYLPNQEGFLDYLHESINTLFNKGTGLAAICDNRLIGYIAGFEVGELFGKCKGIWCPLYGHSTKKEYRRSLYNELYKRVSKLWVKNSFMTHGIALFAHDKEAIDTWFWLGFGLRCVDAIRKVESISVNNSNIVVRKAQIDDIPSMSALSRKLNQYLNEPPLFMPRKISNPTEHLTKWLEKENHHLWVAYHNEVPLGYMAIQPSAETFIVEHPNVMNITKAYVSEKARKSGIGAILLNEIQQWLSNNNYSLCGVDFESFNIEGSRFWTKHFIPYTHSVVRRIDERINMSS